MSRLLYTHQAEEDLLEIWSCIAEDDFLHGARDLPELF